MVKVKVAVAKIWAGSGVAAAWTLNSAAGGGGGGGARLITSGEVQVVLPPVSLARACTVKVPWAKGGAVKRYSNGNAPSVTIF